MGGYGFGPKTPPLPGQPAPRLGPRYASPRPPDDLVSSPTPVANKLVDSVNQFIGGFKESQEGEKQAARQAFFDDLQMMRLGIRVDRKKMARNARKGGLNFDYEGETQPQQQAAPMPGAPPPGGGGGPQGGAPMPGAPMPGGGGGMPGGGGGPGFLGRLGRAISDPFKAAPPIPGNAGVYQDLDRLAQQGQQGQQLQMQKAQLYATIISKPTDSKEFVDAYVSGSAMGLFEDLPKFAEDEMGMQRVADKIPGMTVSKLREKAEMLQNFDAIKPLIGKVADPLAVMRDLAKGKEPTAAALGPLKEEEPLVDFESSYNRTLSDHPGIEKSTAASIAFLEGQGLFDEAAALAKPWPRKDVAEQERAAKADKRADRAEGRADESLAISKRSEGRAEKREAERMDYAARQRNASYYYARANGDLEEAVRMVREDAKANGWVRDDLLDIEAIMQSKSRGGAIGVIMPEAPQAAGSQDMPQF